MDDISQSREAIYKYKLYINNLTYYREGKQAMATALRIQVLETIAALMTAAFGLLAALAWNGAISWAVHQYLTASEGIGLFTYAILVTILAVVMTLLIARILGKAKASVGGEKK
jgi:hypothetical protein